MLARKKTRTMAVSPCPAATQCGIRPPFRRLDLCRSRIHSCPHTDVLATSVSQLWLLMRLVTSAVRCFFYTASSLRGTDCPGCIYVLLRLFSYTFLFHCLVQSTSFHPIPCLPAKGAFYHITFIASLLAYTEKSTPSTETRLPFNNGSS